MKSIPDPTEVQPRWLAVLRAQGRNMAWLAQATGKSYPQVQAYRQGRAKVPADWLARVVELLGEDAA